MQSSDGLLKNSDYFFTVKTTFKNSPPKFSKLLEAKSFTLKDQVAWELPEIHDPDLDEVTGFDMTPEKSYLKLDKVNRVLTFDGSLAKVTDAGLVKFKIKLTDEFGAYTTSE